MAAPGPPRASRRQPGCNRWGATGRLRLSGGLPSGDPLVDPGSAA